MQVAGVNDIENIENDKVPEITLEIIIQNLHNKSKTLSTLSIVRTINSRTCSFSHSLHKNNHNMSDVYKKCIWLILVICFLQYRFKSNVI